MAPLRPETGTPFTSAVPWRFPTLTGGPWIRSGRARLTSAEWQQVLPRLGPTARALVRHRRDLTPEVRQALGAFGPSDFVLENRRSGAPVESESQIRELVARIEAYRRQKDSDTASAPAGETESVEGFRWETGTDGIVLWVEGAPRGPLIGQTIASIRLLRPSAEIVSFEDLVTDKRLNPDTGYATPQLEDQYGKAGKELTFSLARGNMLDSSVRGEKMSELQKLYDIQKQQVADKALSYETSSRNAVEDSRQNLISMLNVTGDAEGAAFNFHLSTFNFLSVSSDR